MSNFSKQEKDNLQEELEKRKKFFNENIEPELKRRGIGVNSSISVIELNRILFDPEIAERAEEIFYSADESKRDDFLSQIEDVDEIGDEYNLTLALVAFKNGMETDEEDIYDPEDDLQISIKLMGEIEQVMAATSLMN